MNRTKPEHQLMHKAVRRMTAVVAALFMIAGAHKDLLAQESGYVELDAQQLDQLVAPIALYPDSLVGQVLTAATYPDQIGEANNWLNQNMGMPPADRAAAADSMPWDPSVKALTAFPSVLNNLAQNNAWASQLGNAYYNQPGDVMNAVQALRTQAHDSNKLVTTAQQRVVVEDGAISIVPVAAEVVCVPYYNPWVFWGPMFVAYPGFVAIAPPPGIVVGVGVAFFPGISIGFYAGFHWGFAAWAPVWGGGVVMFNHSTYISRSVTVVNHGHFGGHDRGAFEHGGRGVPNNYHAAAHAGAARAAAANNHGRSNSSGAGTHSSAGGAQARNNGASHAGSGAASRSNSSSHAGSGTQARNSFSSHTNNGSQSGRSSSSLSGNKQARNNFSSHTGTGSQARNNFASRAGNNTQSHNTQSRNNLSSRSNGGMQGANSSSHAGGGMQSRNNFSGRSGGNLQARNNFPARSGGGARMGGGGGTRMGGGARMGGGGGRMGGGGRRR